MAPPKVNIWEDPLSPSNWKEEHFGIASLTGWGVLIYGRLQVLHWGQEGPAGTERGFKVKLLQRSQGFIVYHPSEHGNNVFGRM